MEPNSIHWRELEAALQHDAQRAFEAAASAAGTLERIGALARDHGERDAFRDADEKELDRRASALRGCALHALTAVIEIAWQAGRLAQMADLRRARSAALGDAEPET
jgi:hypothetical protein